VANNSLWPDVADRSSAVKAIKSGYWAAVFVASVTAAIALISLFVHKPILGIDGLGLFDAVMFAAIAFGIDRKSRAAAVIGLVLYVLERVYMTATNGASASAGIMTIILTLSFVHGIRGTFAYKKFENQGAVADTPAISGE
jgi:hypothetical protein